MSGPEDDAATLLHAILEEIRGLRADLRRRAAATAPALLAAVEEYFGEGRFTAAGLLAVDDTAMTDALSLTIDMNASPRSRATALGMALAKMPDVEIVAQQRGCAVYRLRTSE